MALAAAWSVHVLAPRGSARPRRSADAMPRRARCPRRSGRRGDTRAIALSTPPQYDHLIDHEERLQLDRVASAAALVAGAHAPLQLDRAQPAASASGAVLQLERLQLERLQRERLQLERA